MKTTADLERRIEQLEVSLEDANFEIKSIERELSDKEDELYDARTEIAQLEADLGVRSDSGIRTFVADAIHRRDVLGLDDGDVLRIIQDKLKRIY